MSDGFVSLHRHDSYSTYDGVDLAPRAVEHAKAMGQSAVALTNHGTVAGNVDHYRVCLEADIEPIMGMEAYVILKPDVEGEERQKPFHQTLLVADDEGYRNLMRLVTLSYGHFYYKPRIPLASLMEHSAGLICLSGCPSSMVQRYLQDGDAASAEKVFALLSRAFGDRFYAELQHHYLLKGTAPALLQMAEKYRVPLVATNDAHYVEREDRVVHDLLLRLRRKGKGEENPTYGEGFHMTTRQEMHDLLRVAHPWMDERAVSGSLDETVRIAERCHYRFEKPSRMLPPLWEDAERRLAEMASRGLEARGLADKQEYRDRLARELEVIFKLGYAEYFHVCHEVTSWARSEGILIGPRGSVCGSLLAYALEVTLVDPLVHGTMFERFLHDQKKSFPDVDLDIDSRHRDRVLQYVKTRYHPYALPMITFGRYADGNLSNDLMKAYPDIIDRDTKEDVRAALWQIRNDRIFLASEEDINKYEVFDDLEKQIPEIKRIVRKLYSATNYIGRHPGGICFVPGPHENWLGRIVQRGEEMTSYNFLDVEYIGLLKFDFLGLAAMSTIANCTRLIGERNGAPSLADGRRTQEFLRRIPLDDGACYEAFSKGNTDGIFQYETSGGRSILKEIEPDDFAELTAATALNRPGVSANLQQYVMGKRNGVSGGYFGDTYGAVTYQEQLVRLFRRLDFEWKECDTFLKALKTGSNMYAKSLEEQMAVPLFQKIIVGLTSRGWPEDKAVTLVNQIKNYSFNKAHATGYALVAYWMQYMRLRYPLEFWCSQIEMETLENKRMAYEGAAIQDGIVLLPPHVNGTAGYSIEGNAIRVGTKTIKNVGEKAAAAIERGRPYEKPQDIRKLPKRSVNARVIKALVAEHALDMNMSRWGEYAADYNVKRRDAGKGAIYGYGHRKKATK